MKFAKVKKLIATTLALSMIMTSSVAVLAEPTEPADGVAEEVVEEIVDEVEDDNEIIDEIEEEAEEIDTVSDDALVKIPVPSSGLGSIFGDDREYGHITKNPVPASSLSEVAKGDEKLVGDVEGIPNVYVVPYENITPLRDQAIFGTCWTHGAMASVESNAIIESQKSGSKLPSFTRTTANFSEFHLATTKHQSTNEGSLLESEDENLMEYDYITNWGCNDVNEDTYFIDVEDVTDDEKGAFTENIIKTEDNFDNFYGYDYLTGGEVYSSARAFASWQGPVAESYATYPTNFLESTKEKHNEQYDDYNEVRKNWSKFLTQTRLYSEAIRVDEEGERWVNDPEKYKELVKYDSNMAMVNKANFYRDNICADIINAKRAKDTFPAATTRALTVVNTDMIYSLKTPADMNKLKSLIMENGVCDISYYAADEDKSGSEKLDKFSTGYSYFCPVVKRANHEVAVVGWDDNYPKENFNNSTKIKNNGAWLFKNSWSLNDEEYPVCVEADGDEPHGDYRDGNDHIDIVKSKYISGEHKGEYNDGIGDYTGFFWISYEDPNICEASSFQVAEADLYDNNYFYDGGLYTEYLRNPNGIAAANVFTALDPKDNGKECLEAVNIATSTPNVKATIKIYKNPTDDNPSSGALVTKKTEFFECYGVHTIDLDEIIYLGEGDRFSVVVELEKNGYETVMCYEYGYPDEGYVVNANPGESFLLTGGANKFARATWLDFGKEVNANMCIKAYTKDDDRVAGFKTINYHVPHGYVVSDSEKNQNPYCYDGEGFDDFTPTAPVMEEGCTFKGWYADAAYTKPITKVTVDLADDYGINIYAKIEATDDYMYDAARESGYASLTDSTTLDSATSGKVTVNRGAKKLQLKGKKGTFAVGKKEDKKIVTVNKNNGKLSIKKPGEADITYTAENGATVVKHIVVQEPKVPKLSKNEKTVKVGESKTLSFVSADPKNTFDMINATWEPKGKKKTVEITPTADRKGVTVKGLLKGSATITATINNKKYNFKVKVVE